MSKVREIAQVVTGVDAVDGAGVKLVRLFGGVEQAKLFDPFLMMDGFDSSDPTDYSEGFPWHPHRGIETITYLIEGQIEHQDSLGSIGVINTGDVQWMTAGSGIIHQEMPQPAKRMLGIQLWLNMPQKHKLSKPQYGDILSHKIPVVQEGGNTVRVIAGEYKDTQGAFTGAYVTPVFLDVELSAQSAWQLPTTASHTVFVYIVHGGASFGLSDSIGSQQVVRMSEGDALHMQAGEDGARVLVFAAEPLHEPIAWGGPVVMNTQAELEAAFEQMQNGSFLQLDNKPE